MSKTYRKKSVKEENSFFKHYNNWEKGLLSPEDFGYYYLELYDFNPKKYKSFLNSDRNKRFDTRLLKQVKKNSKKTVRVLKQKELNNIKKSNDVHQIINETTQKHKKNLQMWFWCY